MFKLKVPYKGGAALRGTRSTQLETRSVRASRCEDRVSSFELQVSTYFYAVLYSLQLRIFK